MCRSVTSIGCRVALSFMGLFVLLGREARGESPGEILDLLDGALQTIKSFDVTVNVTRQQFIITNGSVQNVNGLEQFVVTSQRKVLPGESPQISKYHFRQVLQKGKGRMDYFDDLVEQPNRYVVNDEETEKGWSPAQRAASINRPGLTIAGDGMDYRECYLTIIGGVHWLKCLRQRKNVLRVSRGAADNSLVIVEAPAVPPGSKIDLSDWSLRLTMDARHGFMPGILEMFKAVDGVMYPYTRRKVTSWKDHGGVWVPAQMVSQHFPHDPQLKELIREVFDETTLEVNLSRSSWNRDIPEEVFELPLPKGTTVIDFRRNVRYMTGEADPGKNLADLAAHAQDLVPINTGQRKPISPWLLRTLIGGPILLAAILVFAYYLRRRRKNIQGV